jgi:hypothetical protein
MASSNAIADVPEPVASALRELREQLDALYGSRLHAVVLYGSYARNEAHAGSDVDVMVVLEGDVDPYDEMKRMSNLGHEVSAKHDELVTLFPVARSRFEEQSEPVVRDAHREGRMVTR